MSEHSVLLFPGQGAQDLGMGRDLAERNAEVMDLWKKAEKISRIPLRAIYWEGGENMDDTARLQPALTVANLGLWLELSRRFKPGCAAGHSLGEYSALAAAGVLDFEKVMELVSIRGRLMAEADPEGKGAMAAILKLDLARAAELVEAVKAESGDDPALALRIANYNTPAQFVASGSRRAIELLQEKAREFKGRALPLAVSGAFHSPFMAEASAELAACLDKCAFAQPRFPVYCNVTGRAESSAAGLKARLKAQMTSPVQWIDSVGNMFQDGVRRYVECGPKSILGKMVQQILAGRPGAEECQCLGVTSCEDLQAFQ
ncbi:MAG: ACP S-malonyltransferase [Deltaproteobacteria bacterium]|nr:ACP S-malonyltransferase [Deltaproteobacteria bacterium]